MSDHPYRGTGGGWVYYTDENGKERRSRKCSVCGKGRPDHDSDSSSLGFGKAAKRHE